MQSSTASIADNGGWASRWMHRSAEKEQAREDRKQEDLADRRSRPTKGAVWSLFSWASRKKPEEENGLKRTASDLFDRHSGNARLCHCSRHLPTSATL